MKISRTKEKILFAMGLGILLRKQTWPGHGYTLYNPNTYTSVKIPKRVGDSLLNGYVRPIQKDEQAGAIYVIEDPVEDASGCVPAIYVYYTTGPIIRAGCWPVYVELKGSKKHKKR